MPLRRWGGSKIGTTSFCWSPTQNPKNLYSSPLRRESETDSSLSIWSAARLEVPWSHTVATTSNPAFQTAMITCFRVTKSCVAPTVFSLKKYAIGTTQLLVTPLSIKTMTWSANAELKRHHDHRTNLFSGWFCCGSQQTLIITKVQITNPVRAFHLVKQIQAIYGSQPCKEMLEQFLLIN